MSKELIRLRNICMAFDDEQVLDNINLYFNDSEFLTLLGPSGCGKTTTLRIIGGFTTPTSGDVIFDGVRINDVPPHKRQINTVFQKYALFPHLDVFENIAFGLRIAKVPEAEIRERVTEMLGVVSLKGFEKRRVDQLSGGQQQRVAIARALVNRPKVLLLDEPLGALDLRLRKDMQNELKRIQQQMGITFIYVTHDQEEALTLSDRIAVFNNGFVEQVDKPYNIYNHSGSEFVCDFIGEINRLNAAVLSEVETQTGHALDGNKSGYVRLERISLKEIPGYAKMHGVIRDYDYNGVMTKYRVEVMGCEIRVIHVNDGQPFMEIGQELDIYMNPRDIMQF